MKKYITILFLFFAFFAFGQYSFSYYHVDTLTVQNFGKLKSESFYSTADAKDIEYYIKNTGKKYKLVYTFTDWCKPCREEHPKILSLEKENSSNLAVFYLTDIYDGRGFLSAEKYLREIGNSSPIFTIADNEKLKNEKGKYKYIVFDPKKKKDIKVNRYLYYTLKLVPGHQDYGYSLTILYDENNKPVYASTYHESSDEIIRKIKSVIK
ncbi:hypothetical protein [Chryseobacterium sp.]|uniref:TlpA family protein disulfide reductase n=1 Tax=Chryseobacterium sp. TaxID=1871047 RepID=UPI0028973751|nr:hypothetical protein [Chryseobacterium sp.]